MRVCKCVSECVSECLCARVSDSMHYKSMSRGLLCAKIASLNLKCPLKVQIFSVYMNYSFRISAERK